MAETRRGTLRVLACARDERFDDEALAFAFDGRPPGFHCYGATLGDLDLGDYECKPLPSIMPREPGLWLLAWEWQEVPHPEDDDFTTARYADTCEWRRPTMDDLVSLGVLPHVPDAGGRDDR
jgi:hypothetical protein